MRNPEPHTGPQQAHAAPIVPDRNEAERFLAALDPKATKFTFQTFDDDAERKKKRAANGKGKDPFAKVFNGTLAEHWKTLVGLNAKGAGIFVTANITDLQGRTYENMTGIRVVFAELDGAPLAPVLANGALTPHIITESSPDRWHAYWRIDRNPMELHDLSGGPKAIEAVIEQFSRMQKTIAARYGGDPAVHDLPRVMRLPGFVHRKGAPFLSHVITINNNIEPYTWSKLLEVFPPVVEEKPPRDDPPPPRDDDDLPKRWKFLNSYALDHLDLWVPRLFPAATKSKQGYRVSSAALGRNLEEDISFTRDGIVDFGVHDMGDPNQGRRTAIDIVEEWNRCDFEAAVRWLCQALGLDARGYLPKTNGSRGGGGPALGPGLKLGPGPKPRPTPTDADKLLAALNADHCVVIDGARTMVLRFEDIEYDAGGEHYKIRAPSFLRFGDFRNFYLHRRIKVGEDEDGNPRFMDWGKWWLHHPRRRQYDGLIFKPGGAQVIDDRLNLWRGWGVTPKRGDWSLMQRHIREVLAAGDARVAEYDIRWLAWSVQHPDQQPETTPVFLGERGTGKGTIGKALCRIFGQHALHISSSDHLTGRFTGHLRQCSFLFADEAYAPGDKTAEGRLKRMITEPTLTIEAKGRDPVDEPNRLHIMMASNNDWVVPAGEHERRFVVQHVADTHRQEAAWFGPLYAQLRDGGYAAMLFDLLNYNLGDWHPRNIIHTAALGAQQEESLSPLDAWWFELLQTSALGGGNRLRPGEAISNEYEEEITEQDGYGGVRKRTVKRDGLYDQARSMSPKLKGVSDHKLGRYLSERGCESTANIRWAGKKSRGWKFPPFVQCRDEWCKRFPLTEWREPDLQEWNAATP